VFAAMAHEYDVFISYSHAKDEQLAADVQHALHRLTKPWYRRRALTTFRDAANLAADADLWSELDSHLAKSRYLLLLACPDAAGSTGVAHEVEYWVRHRSPESLLIARTGGVIEFRERAVDWAATTALPACLRDWLTTEPLVPDLTGQRLRLNRLKDPKFRSEVLKIAGKVHGRSPDELDGLDLRQHRRTIRAVVATLSAFLVVAVVAAIVSVSQRNEAVAQQRAAEDQRQAAAARLLAAKAENERSSDPSTSLAASLAALELEPTPEVRAGLVDTLMGTRLVGTAVRTGDPTIGGPELALTPDGRIAITSAPLGRVENHPDYRYGTEIWDTSNPNRWAKVTALPELRTGSTPELAISRDGQTLAVASDKVTLWDIGDRGRPRRLGDLPANFVTSMDFGDGALAVAGNGRAALWNVANPRHPARFAELPEVRQAGHVAFAPDGRTLATTRDVRLETRAAANDHQTTLWDVGDPTRPTRPTPVLGHFSATVFSVAFRHDGRLLATAGADGTVVLWDLADRTRPVRRSTLRGQVGWVHDVAFSPQGTSLVSGDDTGIGIVWDVTDPARPARHATLSGQQGAVNTVAFGWDGILTSATDGTVNTWRTTDRRGPSASATLRGHQGTLTDVALGSDDDVVATASDDGSVRLTDISDPRAPRPLPSPAGDQAAVNAIAFDPDGDLLATAVADSVHLWNVRDPAGPRRIRSLPLDGPVNDVAIGGDGRTLVTATGLLGGADGSVEVWDISDPAAPVRSSTFGTGADVVEFAPDGRRLAVGAAEFELWDLAEPAAPRRIATMPELSSASSFAFRSDGLLLAVGDSHEPRRDPDRLTDTSLTLVDLTDPARPRRRGAVDAGLVDDLTFSPAGDTVLTAGGHPALWEVRDPDRPALLSTLAGHADSATTVAFGADGRTVVSGSGDATAIVWDLGDLPGVVAHWKELACTAAGDGFSDEEWAGYAPGVSQPHPCR
jgi:WD40 repeat protein